MSERPTVIDLDEDDAMFLDMGLVLEGGRVLYGWKHGWFRGARLDWLRRLIETAWNRTACVFLGHIPCPVRADFDCCADICLYCGREA